jgi:hypothetical protein
VLALLLGDGAAIHGTWMIGRIRPEGRAFVASDDFSVVTRA